MIPRLASLLVLLALAAPAAELSFSLKPEGLGTLTWGDHHYLRTGHDGDLAPFARTPILAGGGHAGSAPASSSHAADTVTRTWPWGIVEARYTAIGSDRLDIAITVTNHHQLSIERLMLQVARMHYSAVPTAATIGQPPHPFTGGVFGAADSTQRPPVVHLVSDHAAIAIGANRFATPCTAGVFFAEDGGRINRAGLSFHALAPGESQTTTLTFRFGPPDATFRDLAGDVLDAYVQAHPMTLDWPDRRPIGKLFLASAGNGPDQLRTNPNRWFMNAKDVDVSTDAGREAFRERVLAQALGSIKALEHLGAQGGITWDPEGQRTGHTYYGDPRIIQWIAPEMEYRGEHELATIDAYFKVFDDAGLRHGICVRPQRVRPEGDYWVQEELADPEARFAELDVKIGYAIKRWGSTLIYIDSDYHISALAYAELHRRYPAVLLIPEWEQPLHYAHTAPLQSLFHHGATGTPTSIRDLYPKAFTVNMMDNIGQVDEAVRARVAAAVRGGDVPMVNGWYIHAGMEAVRTLYNEADGE